jgi:hypothetical protein
VVTRRLIAGFARQRRDTPPAPPCWTGSPSGNPGCCAWPARGLSSAGIRGIVVITEDTTKTHVRHLLARLSLRDRAQAGVLGCETGLVMPGC